MTKNKTKSAGSFSAWLRNTRRAIKAGRGVQVACGQCTGCCKSSYFIHIRPKEIQTLAKVPKKFLAPAPGLPTGHVLMGYYDNGRCPMLIAGKCSIYEQRPLTCRQFDCRVFAAAGMAAGGRDKASINQQLRRWEFTYPTKRDRDQHNAVKIAAILLESQGYLPSEIAKIILKADTKSRSGGQNSKG